MKRGKHRHLLFSPSSAGTLECEGNACGVDSQRLEDKGGEGDCIGAVLRQVHSMCFVWVGGYGRMAVGIFVICFLLWL